MEQVWKPAWDMSLELTAWLQTAYPQLEGFFLFVTDFGLEQFYLLIFPLIYWCINKRIGKQLGYVFLFTLFLNGIFKQAFRGPRPFWLDENIAMDTREEGYGIPSGHTQNATVLYFFLAAWIGQYWVWFLAVIIVFLMGLSRIYLGAHFLHDVIAGFLLGAVTLLGFAIWQGRYAAGFAKRILGQRLLAVVLAPVVLAGIFIVIRLLLGQPDMNLPWSEWYPTAEVSSIEAAATAFGLLFGFGVGIVFEGSRVRFTVDGPIWKRVLRYVLGIVVLVVIWAGLDQVFPEEPLALAIPLRILRYFLTVTWAAYWAPLVFVKLKLADSEPEPQIDLTLR